MQAKHGSRVRQTNHTVLFVDRGFPIDVIFYASVWEEEGKRRKEHEGKQGSGCDALHPMTSVSSWLTQPGITRKVQKQQVGEAEAHTSIKHPLV